MFINKTKQFKLKAHAAQAAQVVQQQAQTLQAQAVAASQFQGQLQGLASLSQGNLSLLPQAAKQAQAQAATAYD